MKALRALALTLFVCSAALAQQAAALLPVPEHQFLNASGAPLAGGMIYTCTAGSTCTPAFVGDPPVTPLASYTDSTAHTTNANPVILDSAGRASIWIGAGSYKIVAQDSNGVTQWTQDNVSSLSLTAQTIATGSATVIQYAPTATGGQTRTLAGILADTIDAANYDTITHAFADACSSAQPKAVLIPATLAATQTYLNSCGAPTMDYRFGTSSAPGTSRSFTTPAFGGTIYDASPASSNPLSQGDGTYTPINSFRVFESGAANAVALYTEYHAQAGATGNAYGLSANVLAHPGSAPGGIAHNWTVNDATALWITGCTRASNSATCNVNASGPPINLGAGPSGAGCFYITGTTDSTFTDAGLVQCGTIGNSGYSITWANAGANTSIGAGGWIAPPHQVFGFELNLNNANHDPGPLGPQGGLPLPVWGFVSSNTPYTWVNPTGGANIINQPITAGFAAPNGGNRAVAGAQYYGFYAADAINDLFLAGNPQTGGGVSTALSAFRARPIGVATNGNNYRSHNSCWDDSISNGAGSFNEFNYCVSFQPLSSSAANSDSALVFRQNGWAQGIEFIKTGHILADSGSASDPTYGFPGWSGLGMWNNGGTITLQGPSQVVGALGVTNQVTAGSLNVTGSIQSNGTPGLNATKTAGSCTFTITNGLITAVTGC